MPTTRPVILVGSGASLAAPSRLALFGHIRSALLSAVTTEASGTDQLVRRLSMVAPEVAFQALADAGVDVAGELVSAFDSARPRPNAVHEIVAHHLAAGGRAWTTNYDTLIERAWRTITRREGAPPGLVKPHGTFVDGIDAAGDERWVGSEGLVFAGEQVLSPWSQEQEDAFVAACSDAGSLVVLGYSGEDVNARGAVRAALRVTSDVTWHEREGTPAELADRRVWMTLRLPELAPSQVRWSDNPSRDLVASMREPGWDLAAPAECVVDGHRCDLGGFASIGARPRVIAELALDVGERGLHRTEIREVLARGTPEDVKWARKRQLAEAARIARPMWNVAKPVLARVPNPKRGRARSSWVATHPLRSPERARQVEEQLSRWLPQAERPSEQVAIQLDRARALRIMGRYTEAVEAAREAMQLAVDEGDATAAGRAEMETVEGLRVLGRFDEALDAGAGRYDTLGLIHWLGWNAYELGCTFIQLRQLDAAGTFVARAASFFGGSPAGTDTAYDRSLGHGYSLLARAALHRLTGVLDAADRCLGEVASTRYREGREQIAVAALLQTAEVTRAKGDLVAARSLYERLPDGWENYPALAHIGLAYCTGGSGAEAQGHLDLAATLSAEQDSIFGLALCLQAASDLVSRQPDLGSDARAAESLRSRIFGELTPDPTRSIGFL